MVLGRLDEAAKVMEGELTGGDPRAEWQGAVLDSRRVAGGELFFALPGERTDGHRWVGAALAAGAAAAVVAQPVADEGPRIRVDDTVAALHRLTRWARRRTPRRLVAITGSVGKTTTKELLAAMLAARFKVARSPGNLNNLLGFPVALLAVPEDCDWMVAEMGMSTPGELAAISRLGRPDVAVFLNVRPAHLESLGSLGAVAEAKAELLEGLAPDGLVVANREDPLVVGIARRHPGRVVFFGGDAGYRVERTAGGGLELVAPGERAGLELPLHGSYNVDNCLAAAACAHVLGVPLAAIAAAAATVEPPPGRGVVHRLPSGATLIDDSYNSNPEALRRALESAAELPAGRRWAVLGDMLELGAAAPGFHRAAGELAARLGFSPVVGVGELARELVAAAAAAGAEGRWFATAAEAAAALAGAARRGDLVLVKGSRGVALEAVVAALTAGEEAG